MDFWIFCKLDDVVKSYTSSYIFGNNAENLCLELIADIKSDEHKELLLNEFDLILPQGIIFPHEYENGKLKVLFKELI